MRLNFSFETTEKETANIMEVINAFGTRFGQSVEKLVAAQNMPGCLCNLFPNNYSTAGVPVGKAENLSGQDSDPEWEDNGISTKEAWHGEWAAPDGKCDCAEPAVQSESVKGGEPSADASAAPQAVVSAPVAAEDDYVTLRVSEGAFPDHYGETPVIKIKRPTWEEVNEGRLLMDKFLDEFTKGWSVESVDADGKSIDGEIRPKVLERMANSTDFVRIKQYMLSQGSLNRAVYSIITMWEDQKQAARFNEDDRRDFIQLAINISNVLVQICHISAPELAYFYDHSKKWRSYIPARVV